MCETTWLPSAAVNGYSDIDDVAHFAEQVAQVLVRHFEGHVADEERFRWRVHAAWGATVDGLAWAVELNGKASALEDLLVGGLEGPGGIFDVLEFNVAESITYQPCARMD